MATSFQTLLAGVQAVTCDQRTPTWFILREFIFSSTSAYTALCLKAKHVYIGGQNSTPNTHITVLDILGITRHTATIRDCDVDVEQLFDISNETVDSLQQLTRAYLVLLCKQRRLPYSGTKLQLAQRFLSHEITSNDPGDIIGDLVKCWFLEPIRSDSMKSGTLNEDLI